MSKYESPEINAGSMADIAFLLLIFFLVSTTMDNDLGILKMLPKKENTGNRIELNERNILEITLNNNDELLIENSELIDFNNLKKHIVDFIDNGAREDINGNSCDWCQGAKNLNSSDHPSKAMISLQSSRSTSYGVYVTVQNEINKAYYELRNRLSLSQYGITFKKLESNYRKDKRNTVLKDKLESIRTKYPILIAEKAPAKSS